MSTEFGRRRRLVVALTWTLFAAVSVAATLAQAESVTVNVDEARIMKLPERVATIVIGNPLIADATLQKGGILVITGKGFGATNLLALDHAGKVIMDKAVQVQGPVGDNLVVVYKGTARETFSCTPECAPRITLGDDTKYFGETLAQSGTRAGQAQTSAAAK